MRVRGSRLVLGFGALLVLMAGAMMFLRYQERDLPFVRNEPVRVPAAAGELLAKEPVDLAEARPAPARTAEAGDAPAKEDAPPAAAASTLVHGRVLDVLGSGLPDLPIAQASSPAHVWTRSDAGGRFELPSADDDLVVADTDWYTLRSGEAVEQAGTGGMLVIAARATRLAGVVLDPQGAPVAGALVRFRLPHTVFARFPEPLDRLREPRQEETESGADGTFELRAAGVERAQLFVSREGFETRSFPAPGVDRGDLVLTLAPDGEDGEIRIEGVVVHADGSPAAEADVLLADRNVRTDGTGRFALKSPRWIEESAPLCAVLPGLQAAVVPEFGAILRGAGAELPPQRLVLGAPTLGIEGFVVDADGAPKPGWTVQPIDPVLLLEGHIPPRSVEAVGLRGSLGTRTAADGSFELRGLFDRAYRLQATSGTELLRVESAPIPAGSRNARIVVPADARIPRVAGVVVGVDGRPVEGVLVRIVLVTFRTRNGYTMEHSQGMTTGADGRFELKDVPRRDASLDLWGDGIVPEKFEYADRGDLEDLRVEVVRRLHLRVEGVPPGSNVGTIEVHDARGERLQVMGFQGGGWWSSTSAAIEGGITPILAVPETARSVAFVGRGDAGVLGTRPIAFTPGEITVVRW